MSHIESVEKTDPPLEVHFIDSMVPALAAGHYVLTAQQTLVDTSKNPVDQGYLPAGSSAVTQQLEVRAPRFGVQPEWIHGEYPPDGATGLYSAVLPHVTLHRQTLPWERDDASHVLDDGSRLPWLALLVFGEKELENDPHCLGQTEPRTVTQLLGSEAGVTLPPFDTVGSPIPEEDKETVCRTVLVSEATFRAVAPTQRELPLLTHVRRVNEQHQKARDDLDLIAIGDYAVVVGNRLPRALGGRYVAHLVSLEGWLKHLPTDGQQPHDQGAEGKVRLVSLWSWAFESLPDHSPGFAALTENFVDTQGPGGTGLLLKVPTGDRRVAGAEQQEVVKRLAGGYLPLSCRTEAGRSTYGWYRGPFIPVPAQSRTDRDRRRCAAEALIHLEQYGIFDVSLAVAFTAGRGVALADHAFAAAQLRLRAKAREALTNPDESGLSPAAYRSATDTDAENTGTDTVATGTRTAEAGTVVRSPEPVRLLPGGARARLEQLVAEGLGDRLAPALAAPADVPPGRLSGAGGRSRTSTAATPTPLVTPAAAATRLPAAASLTVQRLRTEPALRERLGAALTGLTGTTFLPAPALARAAPPAPTAIDEEQPEEQPDQDLTAVRNWLIKLRNLTGVPFAHLVPDNRMLPPESLRFFHVDSDWTETLVEGALSVGLAHDFDLVVDDLLFGPKGQAPLPVPDQPLTGLLIRSELVTGWPALEIRPYPNVEETGGEIVLPVLRRETLAADVLLVLVEGVPARVEIAEPQQGVHFGIDEPEGGTSDDPVADGIIRLRRLKGTIGQEIGEQVRFPRTPGLQGFLRPAGPGVPDHVFRIADLAAGIAGELKNQGELTGDAITASDFAIQMINAAQRRTFRAATRESVQTTGAHPHD